MSKELEKSIIEKSAINSNEKEKTSLPYLVYGATPSRLISRTDEVMKLVAAKGKACVHPFNAFPYNYYEGGNLGREKTIEACLRLIDLCGEFWLFGISEGTLIEARYVLRQNEKSKLPKPIKILVEKFDPEWQTSLKNFRGKFDDVLSQIFPSQTLKHKNSCNENR